MFRVTVQSPSGSESHVWEHDELLVGRGEGANLRIEEPLASRNHCVLRVENGGVLLVDLGSANGTSVRGEKVREARLRAGDEFSIGRTRLRVDAFTGSGLALEREHAPRLRPAPVPTGAAPDFSHEIRAMVRNAPWYLISLFVHASLLLLLDLVVFRTTSFSRGGHLAAVQAQDAPAAADEVDRYEPVVEPIEPETLEEMEEFPEEERKSREEADAEAFAVPEEVPDRREIGTGATLTARIRPLKLSPLAKEGAKGVDTSDIDGEQQRARKSVERGMGDNLRGLAGLARDNIVVIQGEFDKMEAILDLYRIPHETVTQDEFLKNRPARMKVLCINCTRASESAPRKRKLAETVRAFVHGGGWVITSDWSVDPFLTLGFPSHVRLAPPSQTNRDTTVDVTPVRLTSPLLEGVFERRLQTRWWLEDSSRFVAVDHDRVEVLVTSEEMRARYGSDIVVFQFAAGKGRVLHLLGHFYQKDGTLTGLAAMQRLILNFLTARFLE